MSSETQIQLVGQYPVDPTNGIQELIEYFKTGDVKLLAHGVYDLVGFGLRLMIGDPTAIMIDPAMVTDACHRLNTAMAGSTNISIPDWMKPILKQAITLILAWLQGQLVTQFFKAHGTISKVPVPG